MFVLLQAKEVEKSCNLEEPIYKTKFAVGSLDNLEQRACSAVMPEHNPFIPINFEVVGEGGAPRNILSNEHLQVYFK
jgi:hypothetical protein